MATPATDQGRRVRCGGRLTATHMLTRTYSLDVSWHWQRGLADLLSVEDVLVVCAVCAREAPGTVHQCGDQYWLCPLEAAAGAHPWGRPDSTP